VVFRCDSFSAVRTFPADVISVVYGWIIIDSIVQYRCTSAMVFICIAVICVLCNRMPFS
jgi:hypothetical protein